MRVDNISAEDKITQLVYVIKRKGLVLFVGSALSRFSPSELPVGTHLRNATLSALAKRAPRLSRYTEAIKNQNPNPELVYQTIHDNVGDHFFGSHEKLDTDKINENHLFLARVAKAGYIRVMLTTNFDHLIEDALRKEGLVEGKDFFVYYNEEGFRRYLTQYPRGVIAIIKLHGTIQHKDSIIATLHQTGRGLTLNQAQILEGLLKDKHVLFVGYSGNDFDNYPKLLSMADTAKGIYWDSRSKELPEYIQRLFHAYQDKAISIIMDLRDLFQQLAQRLDIKYQKPADASNEAGDRLTQSLNEWASEIPVGRVFNLISRIFGHIGDFDNALRCDREALKIAKKTHYRRGEAINLGNIGLTYRDLGNQKKAMRYLRGAFDIYQEISDRGGAAGIFGQIGILYQIKGDPENALIHHRTALRIHQEIGNRQGEGKSLGNIGLIYREIGNLEKALEYHLNSLMIFQEIGYLRGKANELGNVGAVYFRQGDFENALTYYRDALNLHREIGYRQGEANQLGNIGAVYYVKNDSENALRYYEDALKICEEIGYNEGKVLSLCNIGSVYRARGEFENALRNFQAALKISTKTGASRGRNITVRNITEIEEAIKARR